MIFLSFTSINLAVCTITVQTVLVGVMYFSQLLLANYCMTLKVAYLGIFYCCEFMYNFLCMMVTVNTKYKVRMKQSYLKYCITIF